MTTVPRVSAVIPAWNAERYLADCLDSVYGQKFDGGLEVILVDDGSTDATAAMAEGYPDLVLLRQPNRGPAAARNAGIRRARGEWVAFLDADDLWPAGKLQKQLDLLAGHPLAGLCFGDCRQFDAAGPRPRTLFEEEGTDGWGPGPVLSDAYSRLLTANFVTTGSVLARRCVLEELGGFDEALRLVEDLELWLRVARSHPVLWSPEVCLLRRRHAGNLSRDNEAMALAWIEVLRRQPSTPELDLKGLVAGEYVHLAELALGRGEPGTALAWAARAFSRRPGWRALWCWLRCAGHGLRRPGTVAP